MLVLPSLDMSLTPAELGGDRAKILKERPSKLQHAWGRGARDFQFGVTSGCCGRAREQTDMYVFEAGIPRPPHPSELSPYYPLSPGAVGQIPHPLGWLVPQ